MKINYFQLLQFLLLYFISVYVTSKKNEYKNNSPIEIVQPNDEEYNCIQTHIHLSNFRIKIENIIQKIYDDYTSHKSFTKYKQIHSGYIIQNEQDFEYHYIYYNKYVMAYFSKKYGEDNFDTIYFEGLHKITDLQNISILQIFKNKKITFDKKKFHENGILFQIHSCYLKPIFISSFYNSFLYIQNKYYHFQHNIPYSINIEGYSLGGLYSQMFICHLIENGKIENYKIYLYNIESWFYGNKDEYEHFTQHVSMNNILNPKSVFYLFNQYFQKYNKINKLLKVSNDKNDGKEESIKYPFPFGFVHYIMKHHLLSNFVSEE